MSTSSPFLGEPTSTHPALAPSREKVLQGKHVTLTPLLKSHQEELAQNVGGPGNAHLYTYLPDMPDLESFMGVLAYPSLTAWAIMSSDPRHLSNRDGSGKATPVGVICVLLTSLKNRVIEIGGLLFAPSLQRTTEATEAHYLVMKYCFDELGYSRVEWKTNSLNEGSWKAALRLGYNYEGTLRRHMIASGRRRDSAYFSIIEEEWLVVKEALEMWLAEENFDGEGKQRRRLEDIRQKLKETKA